jgi:hypothetical protein
LVFNGSNFVVAVSKQITFHLATLFPALCPPRAPARSCSCVLRFLRFRRLINSMGEDEAFWFVLLSHLLACGTPGLVPVKMGCGRSWSAQALADVAGAYVEVSTNPVTGVEQKGAVFNQAVHAAFVRRDPNPRNPDGGYATRTQAAVIHKFKIISADCQKVGNALRLVHASRPTGVSEYGVLSMSIAVHLGKSPSMDYRFKDFPHAEWVHYKAWIILRAEAKWAGISNAAPQNVAESGCRLHGPVDHSTLNESAGGESELSAYWEPSAGDRRTESTLTPPPKKRDAAAAIDERPIGRKEAKMAQVDIRGVAAVESLARTISQVNEAKQARVDMLYFACSDMDEEDIQFRREFMKLKRKEALERGRGQLSAADGRGSTLAHKRFTNEVGESEMPAPVDEEIRAAESVMTIRNL